MKQSSQPACQAELSLPLQGFSNLGLSRVDQTILIALSSLSSTNHAHIAHASLLTE